MNDKIYLLIIIILIVVFFIVRKRKKNSFINKKIVQLKNLYSHEKVFLCSFIEDIDDKHLQLYGESINTPLYPGMKIVINGLAYTIKEVYADDDTPDKPDPQVPAGVPNTPIIIEKSNLDLEKLYQSLKKDFVLPLKLQ